MVILCLDYGSKNIGVAYSPDGVFSFPVGSIKRTELHKDLETIKKIAMGKRAELIVIGYPASDVESESAKFIKGFAVRIEAFVGVKVILQDERLTSWEIRRVGHELGSNDKKMRGDKDAYEAQLILMRYLDRKIKAEF